MRPRLDAQHAEAALGIMERHPFDGAGEHRAVGLGGGPQRWRLEYSACALGCGEHRERTERLRSLTDDQCRRWGRRGDAVARVAAHRPDAN